VRFQERNTQISGQRKETKEKRERAVFHQAISKNQTEKGGKERRGGYGLSKTRFGDSEFRRKREKTSSWREEKERCNGENWTSLRSNEGSRLRRGRGRGKGGVSDCSPVVKKGGGRGAAIKRQRDCSNGGKGEKSYSRGKKRST